MLLFKARESLHLPSTYSRLHAKGSLSGWGTLVIRSSSPPLSLTLTFTYRFGRENFIETTKISNRVDLNLIDWAKFKYMVFDAPKHSGNYQERYDHLGNLIMLSFSLTWEF